MRKIMNYSKKLKRISITSFAVLSFNLFAAPEALEFKHSIELDSFTGKTFLQTMLDQKNGVKMHFDKDFVQTYQFAAVSDLEDALVHFDKKVVKKVMDGFNNDKEEFREFAETITEKNFRPSTIVEVLKKYYSGKGNIFAIAQFFGMASNAGTKINIDGENYYYNFGYRDGSEADDVKSGRSYGASLLHNANDASDVLYLNELEEFLTEASNSKIFYQTLLEFLTKTDISGFAKKALSKEAKRAATDFIAIYTAELDRHIMVNLAPAVHPWENDLAEATFVSIFSASSGKMLKDGQLTEAPLKDFWAMSNSGSGRSGIGIGRKDRRKLQQLISAYEKENNPNVVEAVEALIGTNRDGDLFRGLMEYLNNKSNQASVKKNADEITKSFVAFLLQVKADSNAIVQSI